MLKGNWFLVFALGLILSTSISLGQPISDGERADPAAAYPDDSPESDTNPRPLVTIQDSLGRIAEALEAANNKEKPTEERDQARRDLNAQENGVNTHATLLCPSSL